MQYRVLDKRAVFERKTPGAAGYDLAAMLENTLTIFPGQVVKIRTGIAVHLGHPGLGGILARRSGANDNLIVVNGVGIIDSDYQGELIVKLRNVSVDTSVDIEPLQRIAQYVPIVLANAVFCGIQEVEDFEDATDRNINGFGSTGLF